ncbi:endonuclease/exonuclease/phosphatase family protein [Bradyrhizobium sp. CB1015]|uniref:endonuclease/exonuclease/phosphatase family protein n=1 Tax=Bradyrhizobium sp. CB1015 TaxID=2976822 RepID=UPI0021AA7EA3|nr:endonuclease/exonuclease/phosphatase family protein [Bradyrhizobium sp. CB1015]UWU89129.1 endonuclease/exonuclease/phosphatase family protein [Bradyrhizobium sp. CB1015]
MNYTGLRWLKDAKLRNRIVEGLGRLRAGLRKKVPAKSDSTLLLATWNIREFGGTKYGGRMTDAMYYIAECMSRFDLIAVQEVRADLRALKEILRLLGRQWDVIFTDVSYADGNNFERLAFVYNTAKVSFTGLAGELVLPSKAATERMSQIARTPFVCGFQVGWAKFNLCTVHIYYGTAKAEEPRRVDEINALANLLAAKAKDYINTSAPVDYSPEHLVLLGDFNIFSRTDATYEAITKNKFEVPTELQKLPTGSNVDQNKFYDQIAFFKQKVGVKNTRAGVFDFFDYVFSDPKEFKGIKGAPTAKSFRQWRTYQMSDHLIMWCEFSVDQTDAYLKSLAEWDGK